MGSPNTKRMRERVVGKILDIHGEEVDRTRMKKGTPNKKELREICYVYNKKPNMAFPKCRYKDKKRARAADRELGYSEEDIKAGKGLHTSKSHDASAVCGCRHVAGYGTRGWWLWGRNNSRGLGEVGHYGVGPCWKHGPFNSREWDGVSIERYANMIKREIVAMQEHELAPDMNRGFLLQLKEDTEVERVKNDMRTVLSAAKGEIEEIYENLKEGGKTPQQYINGELVDMSDKAVYELKLKYFRALSGMIKTDWEIDKANFASKEEVNRLIVRIMFQIESSVRNKLRREEWDELVNEVKRLCISVRYGTT